MGKRFNRWLRMAARQGINVGTASQAKQTFSSGRAAAGKKVAKPALGVLKAQASGIKDAATLSNIAKADNPLKAAKKGTQRKAVMEGAIASGVDPVAAKGLGLVKSIPKASNKAKAQVTIAKAGGDVQSQIDVANSKNPQQKAANSTPGVQAAKQYGDQVKAIEKYNAALNQTPQQLRRSSGGAYRDEPGLKKKKRKRGDRYSQSKGTSTLRIPLNTGSPSSVANSRSAGGINP